MNYVTLTGRLTADPIINRTASGAAVVTYTLAVNRTRSSSSANQPTADFVRCVAFGRVGEFANRYLYKGVKIGVEGRLQSGSYEKDGTRHYSTEVVVETHEFLEPKRSSFPHAAGTGPAVPPTPASEDLLELADVNEDDLPF